MDRSNKNHTFIFFCVTIVLSNLSYYPLMQQTSFFREIVIISWGIIALLVGINCKLIISEKCKSMFILLVIFVLNTIILYFAGNNESFRMFYIFPLTCSFIVCVISYSFFSNEMDIKKLISLYALVIDIIAIPLFVLYLLKTDLTSSIYIYTFGKNEISVLLMSTLIINILLEKKEGLWLPGWLRVVGLIFIILDLIYLRCRTVYIGLVFFLLYLLFDNKSIKRSYKIVILLIVAIIGIYLLVNREYLDWFINNIVFAGRNRYSFEDVSSGRFTQINEGLKLFLTNPLGGAMYTKSVDCFYVSVLANYGILSWPIIVMSFFPLTFAVKNYKYNKDFLSKLFLCISFSIFFISLFEELAPFGSGVRCYILWMLYGALMRRRDEYRYERLQ